MIQISWLPILSLNLAYAEPDFVYCVNVSRVVNKTKTHVMTNCSVLGNEYVYRSTDNKIPKEQNMYYYQTSDSDQTSTIRYYVNYKAVITADTNIDRYFCCTKCKRDCEGSVALHIIVRMSVFV